MVNGIIFGQINHLLMVGMRVQKLMKNNKTQLNWFTMLNEENNILEVLEKLLLF